MIRPTIYIEKAKTVHQENIFLSVNKQEAVFLIIFESTGELITRLRLRIEMLHVMLVTFVRTRIGLLRNTEKRSIKMVPKRHLLTILLGAGKGQKTSEFFY